MERRIDMTPYEEEFTKLEKCCHMKIHAFNIAQYIKQREDNFSEEQVHKILNHYYNMIFLEEIAKKSFYETVILPLSNNNEVSWRTDFKERELIVYDTI